MSGAARRGVAVFDRDAVERGGYGYTTNQRLSSGLATGRSTELILSLGRFAGRRVLDVGCGDGFYTRRFWDLGRPRWIVGVDAAPNAVAVARECRGDRRLDFLVADGHRLPFADDSFDLVLVQSILHHDNDPGQTVREAFRLAPEILIHEPNGYNPGLKLLERTSRYHLEHGERSYTARRLRRWIRAAGGRVVRQAFAGFVPMFCPDWLARATKAVEPLVERLPVVNTLGCAVYVVVARRRGA